MKVKTWWHECIGNAGDGIWLQNHYEICPFCGVKQATKDDPFPHDHSTFVDGCVRCDLARAEMD